MLWWRQNSAKTEEDHRRTTAPPGAIRRPKIVEALFAPDPNLKLETDLFAPESGFSSVLDLFAKDPPLEQARLAAQSTHLPVGASTIDQVIEKYRAAIAAQPKDVVPYMELAAFLDSEGNTQNYHKMAAQLSMQAFGCKALPKSLETLASSCAKLKTPFEAVGTYEFCAAFAWQTLDLELTHKVLQSLHGLYRAIAQSGNTAARGYFAPKAARLEYLDTTPKQSYARSRFIPATGKIVEYLGHLQKSAEKDNVLTWLHTQATQYHKWQEQAKATREINRVKSLIAKTTTDPQNPCWYCLLGDSFVQLHEANRADAAYRTSALLAETHNPAQIAPALHGLLSLYNSLNKPDKLIFLHHMISEPTPGAVQKAFCNGQDPAQYIQQLVKLIAAPKS